MGVARPEGQAGARLAIAISPLTMTAACRRQACTAEGDVLMHTGWLGGDPHVRLQAQRQTTAAPTELNCRVQQREWSGSGPLA